MLTKSETGKERDKIGASVEEDRDRIESIGRAIQTDAQKVRSANYDATNHEVQAGRVLTAEAFFKRLKKLLPNAYGVRHPRFEHKSVFGLVLPDGTQVHVSPGEFPNMPEWSILEVRQKLVPVVSPHKLHTGDGIPIEYFPYRELEPMALADADVFEIARGWRTILVYFIKKGYLSLELVEQEFGVGDRASWAALLKEYKIDAKDSASPTV